MMKTTEKQTNKQFDLSASTLQEAQDIAKILASSDMVPSHYKGKPSNVLIAVQMGAEIGLKPMQALQGIAVIKGMPCVWGDALLAVAMGHPEFEDIIEEIEGDTAICTVKRKGRSPCIRRFSKEDAKRAGLYSRDGVWKTYPQRMLQMRARSWAIRDLFADALKGIQTREEVEDIPKERIVDASVIEETQGMSNTGKIRKELASRVEKTVEEENTNDEKTIQHEDSQEDIDYPVLLNKMINDKQVPPSIWSPWLAKAKVSSISELDDDQAKKCIDFLEKKYFDEKTGEVFDAKNFMDQ